ncbi:MULTISPECIES: hypothetical protein [Streptomyces]|uniref:hypothetical protein n=1 Tax=Streptomyces TaxID=1883 RepID=UPI00292DCA19|nr:hypothetical protein [Streptomyces sp. NEAU-HV9]
MRDAGNPNYIRAQQVQDLHDPDYYDTAVRLVAPGTDPRNANVMSWNCNWDGAAGQFIVIVNANQNPPPARTTCGTAAMPSGELGSRGPGWYPGRATVPSRRSAVPLPRLRTAENEPPAPLVA